MVSAEGSWAVKYHEETGLLFVGGQKGAVRYAKAIYHTLVDSSLEEEIERRVAARLAGLTEKPKESDGEEADKTR